MNCIRCMRNTTFEPLVKTLKTLKQIKKIEHRFSSQQTGQFTPLKSVRQARYVSMITAVHDLRSVAYVHKLLLWPSKWES